MNALVLQDIGKLDYCQIEMPKAAGGEVIVKVMAAGVCGSDIPRAFREGAHKMPLIIGHEFAGIVEETAADADERWKGKRVGVFPLIPCRKCSACAGKQYEMCKNYSYLGSRRDGGFAQYVAVPQWNLIEIPEEVSFEKAAMLEPMAVAVHAMRRVEINRTDTVAICGLGTIGTLLAIFLLDMGVKNILVIGNKDFQKTTITGLGIPEDNYCDSRSQSVDEFIQSRTDGLGADVFFECVGSNESVNYALNNTIFAGKICFVGNPHGDMFLEKNLYWKILRNQLRICGTWNSSYTGEETDDWHYVIERLQAGNIQADRLITHRYSLQDIIKGMELMRDKSEDYIKIMAFPNMD